MIESEVHLVEDKHFLVLASDHRTVLVVCLAIIALDARKLRVLNAHVNSAHCESNGVCLVCFQRTRNSQLVLRVSVQNVHKFLLLHGANHQCSPLGINS